MNNKERGERIRRQIIRDVRYHPADISKHITEIFSITPQAVNNHIRRLENEGWLKSSGSGKGKRYFLGELREYRSLFPLIEEFTEMVNNVIDHSGGKHIYIAAIRDIKKIMIYVIDDGEGIFRKIKRLCNLTDERQALFELSKGKLTTDPDNHTGEGIFFTSRAFDEFEIDSRGVKFSHDDNFEFDYILESEISKNDVGTAVSMLLGRDTERDIQKIFDDFAGPDDFQFNKTVIPVRLAQYGNEKLVSRSQARRLLARIERFQYVIFDFVSVSSIGQAFADEIFRVYAQKHPNIVLLPDKMESNVEKMVNRAISSKVTK